MWVCRLYEGMKMFPICMYGLFGSTANHCNGDEYFVNRDGIFVLNESVFGIIIIYHCSSSYRSMKMNSCESSGCQETRTWIELLFQQWPYGGNESNAKSASTQDICIHAIGKRKKIRSQREKHIDRTWKISLKKLGCRQKYLFSNKTRKKEREITRVWSEHIFRFFFQCFGFRVNEPTARQTIWLPVDWFEHTIFLKKNIIFFLQKIIGANWVTIKNTYPAFQHQPN